MIFVNLVKNEGHCTPILESILHLRLFDFQTIIEIFRNLIALPIPDETSVQGHKDFRIENILFWVRVRNRNSSVDNTIFLLKVFINIFLQKFIDRKITGKERNIGLLLEMLTNVAPVYFTEA